MRLLIIEDCVEVLNYMKTELEKNGFYVDIASNGTDGEEKAYINDYDIILLDLTLPDKSGIDILRYLRKENIQVPVIIISGISEKEEIIRGFNLGADDYMTKPFLIDELVARINAVIRRFHGKLNPSIKIGDIVIDTTRRRVTFNDEYIDLTSKEYDILEYLAIKHPATISSEELLEHVYDEYFDSFSSVLRVHITKLRRKIKEIAGKDILINIRGKGYSIYND